MQAVVDDWNAEHAPGTDVIHTNDFGVETQTKTRSYAELLGGHTPVVWLEGMTGCHGLDRVRPVPKEVD